VWSGALCVWGAFLLVVGALAHHASVLGILAGVICLGAGLRWLILARRVAPPDAQGPETR
jgi:hypothetical protein